MNKLAETTDIPLLNSLRLVERAEEYLTMVKFSEAAHHSAFGDPENRTV